jgi:HAD superfamily hydrolase (TIGR01459 family)
MRALAVKMDVARGGPSRDTSALSGAQGGMRKSSFAPDLLSHAGLLLQRYDVLFCDVWGVLHDGQRAFDASNAALIRFRAGGGTVILVSNAPSPAAAVARTLDAKAVARDAYDAIVSSGDIALAYIREHGFSRVHRIGAMDRDRAFFDAVSGPDTALDQCDAIACTGLVHDQTETGEDYRARLAEPARRRVPFICANPDLVVHVGDRLLPCAGAIATVYEALGGPVVWAGKPRPSAYVAAFAAAEGLRGHAVARDRVLAIGDAVRTDLAGAAAAGIDALFITSGIHRDDIMRGADIDAAAVRHLLTSAGIGAVAAMAYLGW